MRVTLVLWLTMQIGVIAGIPSRMESLELRMTKLEESLRKFITAFASHPESAGKGDHHVMKRQAVDEGGRDLDDLLTEISVNGIVTLLRGRDGHDGEDGSPGVPGVPGRDGTPGSPGDQGPRGLEGNCSHTCQARPAARDNIWRQGNVENFLKVTNLPALSQMTACFYYKPSHIGHVGEVTNVIRALISIASDSKDNELILGFQTQPVLYLGLHGQPETNSITYGLEAFSEAHRHCFVWKDGNFLKWFYDSDTPGVLKLAAQVADSGSSNIPAGSTLVLLNEQDSKGGSLDVRQMIAGDIADFQMWDRALLDSQVEALGCGEVGNVVTFDDITPVGISHFHRDSTFQCSNSN